MSMESYFSIYPNKMKTLFYAAMAASFALVVSSCEKDRVVNQSTVPLNPGHELKFIQSKVLQPGEKMTMIRIDSNTAIIRPGGDTLFPRWYYKEKLAAAGNARTL